MQSGAASRTAHEAATHRAAHQLLEHGSVHSDPLALRILGEDPDAVAQAARAHPKRRELRLFVAARQRFAEDMLAGAVERGVRQLVVLGAGLDTYAYRNPHAELSVFEVDHPATQAWKRERLAQGDAEASCLSVAVPRRRLLGGGPLVTSRQRRSGSLRGSTMARGATPL